MYKLINYVLVKLNTAPPDIRRCQAHIRTMANNTIAPTKANTYEYGTSIQHTEVVEDNAETELDDPPQS